MIRRLAQLIPGLLLYGVADAFMIEAALGVDPWTVFAQGLSLQTGLGIGLLTNLIGVLVLLLWWPLRQKPGIGTLLNILLVGPGIELGLWLLPTPEALWVRIAYFTIGLLLLAVASGIYIGADLGPGPRDGLMTGIHLRFGTPIWVGRTAVEVTVLLIGWALGGNVGIGTVVFAALIGPLCSITLPLFAPRAIRRDRGAGTTTPAAPPEEQSTLRA
ncbi:YczE/YyaS/YitT family protein [Leucobacter chromiiresistens]|uniref:Membrane protein n=1 Tax=Leucobacter chromiiresistens TaxID=1079994 RepID=A0A147EQP1_9MICO|nr:membrane protein [Leucobacter chromiiresistens]KTR86829.1 membrane protein [Leucobacter chromiiresistens]